MFDLENVVRFVSMLTYLGFIIGSISGFIEISKVFNLCEMFVCILILISNLGMITLHLTNTLSYFIKNEKNKLYISSLFMFICSLLILGLSDIAVVFGLWGIIMSICTTSYAIFSADENDDLINDVRNP